MALELKHVTPYLPYDLQIEPLYQSMGHMGGFHHKTVDISVLGRYELEEIKPILRPISDLTIENMKDFSGVNFSRYSEDFLNSILEAYKKDIKIQNLSYRLMQPLFENHFDIFGLIEKGLAIDINTIKKG